MFLPPITHFLVITILLSCSEYEKPISLALKQTKSDTTIHAEVPTNGICGPATRRKEKDYYLIVNQDTSNVICTLSESKYSDSFIKKGDVGMRIYFYDNKSYHRQLIELEKTLQLAAKEFSFDSLKGIATIYLAATGDLAIDITKQMSSYDLKNVNNNRKTAEFLLKSKLSTDLNRLFAPYKKNVKEFAIEHPMLTDSSFVTSNRAIETPQDQIPSRILSGTVWVHF